jgi:hypothetical protein
LDHPSVFIPREKIAIDERPIAQYTQNEAHTKIPMKKPTTKKIAHRAKGAAQRGKGGQVPLEFDRSWQDLEAMHDRIKSDWSSLAAQMGIGSRGKSEEY